MSCGRSEAILKATDAAYEIEIWVSDKEFWDCIPVKPVACFDGMLRKTVFDPVSKVHSVFCVRPDGLPDVDRLAIDKVIDEYVEKNQEKFVIPKRKRGKNV